MLSRRGSSFSAVQSRSASGNVPIDVELGEQALPALSR
jgi:hypothetical protein